MTTNRKSVKLIFMILMSATLPASFAQEMDHVKRLQGSWLGPIRFRGMELPMVLNVVANAKDSLTITFDSPSQGAKDIPTSGYSFKGDSILIELKSIASRFTGKIDGDSIHGAWKQAGMSLPITLAKKEKRFEYVRPQTPQPPFPYDTTDVTFRNEKAGIDLAGTITKPKSGGPFPAVVMITGSGLQNRDEELLGHKPFLVIADWLTRQGIAVLRYDDRGVAKSGGVFSTSTSYDFADDAEAAFNFLKKQKNIDTSRVGFIGHSEGGMIAPIIASRRPDVAFIVLMAGPGLTGEEILLLQLGLISRANGEKEEDIRESQDLSKKIYAVIKKEKDNDKADQKIKEIFRKYDRKHAADSGYKKTKEADLSSQIKTLTSPWFRCFLTFNPSGYLTKVKCPLLALNGTLDTQVPWEEDFQAIEKAMIVGGNPNYELKEFDGLNHLFQRAKTGSPTEYSNIETTIEPVVLEKMSGWILGIK